MIKTFQHKPIIIEAIQFEGDNFDEIIDFIGSGPVYYIEYVGREKNRIGMSSEGEIFWLQRNCWVSRRNGLCFAHENSFESWLCRNCEILNDRA